VRWRPCRSHNLLNFKDPVETSPKSLLGFKEPVETSLLKSLLGFKDPNEISLKSLLNFKDPNETSLLNSLLGFKEPVETQLKSLLGCTAGCVALVAVPLPPQGSRRRPASASARACLHPPRLPQCSIDVDPFALRIGSVQARAELMCPQKAHRLSFAIH
jgi:hypothetical protein